jgi:hypothetical protein
MFWTENIWLVSAYYVIYRCGILYHIRNLWQAITTAGDCTGSRFLPLYTVERDPRPSRGLSSRTRLLRPTSLCLRDYGNATGVP